MLVLLILPALDLELHEGLDGIVTLSRGELLPAVVVEEVGELHVRVANVEESLFVLLEEVRTNCSIVGLRVNSAGDDELFGRVVLGSLALSHRALGVLDEVLDLLLRGACSVLAQDDRVAVLVDALSGERVGDDLAGSLGDEGPCRPANATISSS